MEELRKYPPAADRLFSWGIVVVCIIVAVSIGFLAVGAISTDASEQPAVNTDYAQLYQEALSQIDELHQTNTVQAEQLESMEQENAALLEQLAQQDALIAELEQRADAAEQENLRLIEKYGTVYYVDYEIRHTNLLCPEAVLHFTTTIPFETYSRLRKGDELPVATEFHSVPSDGVTSKWTAVVVDVYPYYTWPGNP